MYQIFYAESVRTVRECDVVATRSSRGGGCGGKDVLEVAPMGDLPTVVFVLPWHDEWYNSRK